MSDNEVQLNSTPVIRVHFKKASDGSTMDISGATGTKEIILKSPSGVRTANPANFATDGTDGDLDFAVPTAFLSELTEWRVQGHVVLSGDSKYTEIDDFEVLDNL